MWLYSGIPLQLTHEQLAERFDMTPMAVSFPYGLGDTLQEEILTPALISA